MAFKVSRFALLYNPPTLMVEYNDMTDDTKYVKKINIKNLKKVKVDVSFQGYCEIDN
jgi:hypothetical protein